MTDPIQQSQTQSMYSYSVQYSLKSETKKTRELMLLSLAGTNCSTKSVSKEKKDGKWICLSRSQVQREIKDKDSGGWHQGGRSGIHCTVNVSVKALNSQKENSMAGDITEDHRDPGEDAYSRETSRPKRRALTQSTQTRTRLRAGLYVSGESQSVLDRT